METRLQVVPVVRLQRRRVTAQKGSSWGRRHTDTQLKVERGPCTESPVGAKLVQGREGAHVCLWVTSGQRWDQNQAGGKTQEQLGSSRGSEIPAERNTGPC